ncbi:MAG: M1 family metallopeptidase [Bacteroidetes bacterium]|nr:M1 family metallopeptidase [Bacteroidota bacterium]
MKKIMVMALGALSLSACNEHAKTAADNAPASDTVATAKDEHTQSNADEVTLKHLNLDIAVDFDRKQIAGCATWAINNHKKVSTLKLDTYDLTIDSVYVDGRNSSFLMKGTVLHLGEELDIPIEPATGTVSIYYKTGKNARALQWLDPAQTNGKKFPFLYTQSESIYARSWIPCADGPGIRYTYDARVKVPKGLLALMSADNPQQANDSGIYHFKMDIPIPAYLMALAVGDIKFRPIDARTGVYAESSMIDKARYEFEDVGKMVTTAEQLYGPYRWGRYDAIVLPPGFPIGGMENPKLTFCTPTIIAGDRSLMNLIAHELAHNWSGNLVTNATWNDFWLNEGFTVYFERRITEAMTDKSYADMLWELGYQDFEKAVEDLGKDSKDTWLKLDLKGRDPDDGLTDIPYEKGAAFLKLIENTVGRPRMDSFLKQYFDEHAFKTITTEQFLAYLNEHLIKGDSGIARKLDINAWVYGPGIPANCPRVQPERFKKVDEARTAFLNGTSPETLQTKEWSTNEWLHFLRKMPSPLSQAQMQALDKAFHFTNSGNSEIADLWYTMAIPADYKPAFPAMDKFLSRVGRRKFLEPLYEGMMKNSKQDMAKAIYAKYKQNYHPLAQEDVDAILAGKN